MRYKKIGAAILLCFSALFVVFGCAKDNSEAQEDTAVTAEGMLSAEDMFSDRDKEIGYDETQCINITLADNGSSADDSSVAIDGNTVTVTKEGTYLISGTLSDGQLVVETEDTEKIQLVLNSASVTNDTSAALYVKNADKVFLTTAKDTENTLDVTGEFVAIDDNNIDAAVFSKDDLTLNGAGTLNISCGNGHGVVSKDDLKIACGTYTVTAASHGLCGKNSVRVADGTISVNSGKDGIHSENTDDISLGYVFLGNGTLNITAGQDGIDAQTILQAEDGNYTVVSGGGSANAAVSSGQDAPGNTKTYDDSTASAKCFKVGSALFLKNGTYTLDSVEDTLHSNGLLTVYNGTYQLNAGDDALHSDTDVTVSGGTIHITQSYEGIEGQTVTIADGVIDVVSSDDGVNAAGGNDSSGTAGGGKDQFSADENCSVTIGGGTLSINAKGDGIDSNGDVTVSGGSITVSGPTDNANGTFDYAGTATITGGTFFGSGSSGMAQGFDADSTQCSILYNLGDSYTGGTQVTLADSEGNVLMDYTAEKDFSSVLCSCAEIQDGGSYTLTVGGKTYDVTMDGTSYSNGGAMGGGAPSGDMPSGNPPDRDGGFQGGGNGGGKGDRSQ